MPSEPRTIRGPCFDCDDDDNEAWEYCPCRRQGLRSTRKALSRKQRKLLLYLSQLMDVVEPCTEYLPICVTAARIIRNATY